MATFTIAQEFAGLAAQDIVRYFRPAEPEAGELFRFVRECCVAAILGAILRQNWESRAGAHAAE